MNDLVLVRILGMPLDFCRAGDLLTIATEPETVAFRRWYLGEFERQVAGQPVRTWSAVMDDAGG